MNTQRMLEILGRTDTIPEVTKLRRIEKMKASMPPRPRPDGAKDREGQEALAAWEAKLKQQTQAIKDEELVPEEIPGLKVHVCSLVAPDSPPGKPWMPVYIHSKLMIVDDVFTTHGSANINSRSMEVDSELNIAHEWASVTEALRRRLWDRHTAGEGYRIDRKRRTELGKKSLVTTKIANPPRIHQRHRSWSSITTKPPCGTSINAPHPAAFQPAAGRL
ncbi:hypothetical protein J7302_05845 [Pseudomonas sp. DB1]|uniref:PLD phosphodiesterase domain-containing protein n=1 Tax=Metapseudomonas boanensis TaxID=2822138 RepID=A0ABS5XEY9_9GAMM|nr:hypothetical protein [Pseudomonas boanensis]